MCVCVCECDKDLVEEMLASLTTTSALKSLIKGTHMHTVNLLIIFLNLFHLVYEVLEKGDVIKLFCFVQLTLT